MWHTARYRYECACECVCVCHIAFRKVVGWSLGCAGLGWLSQVRRLFFPGCSLLSEPPANSGVTNNYTYLSIYLPVSIPLSLSLSLCLCVCVCVSKV